MNPPFRRLRPTEWLNTEEQNRALAELERAQRVSDGDGFTHDSAGFHTPQYEEPWFWARITGKGTVGSGEPVPYKWSRLGDTAAATWEADPADQKGTETVHSAFEINNTPDVPTDGSAVVQLFRARGGEYFWFRHAPRGVVIEEVDGAPAPAGVQTLRFDQADGFVVTSVSPGVARVDQTPASDTTVGYVTIGAQTIAGVKTFQDKVQQIATNGTSGRYILSDPTAANYGAVSYGTLPDTTVLGPSGVTGLAVGVFKSANSTQGNFITFQANTSNIYLGGKGTLTGVVLHVFDGSTATDSYVPGVTGTASGGVQSITCIGGVVTDIVGGGGLGYTDEQAKDAVGGILTDTATVDATYDDAAGGGAGEIKFDVKDGALGTAKLGGDITAAGKALLDDADAAAQRSTLGLGTVATLASDTDTTLAANSDARVPTQKAVKTYVDTAVTGLLDFKGSTDASGNPNYPAASKGDAYVISVAGRVGGASGKQVEVGDVYLATADNAGGTEASVGTSWTVLEHNLVGAALTSGTLAQFAATTSAQLAGVISDETGSGALVFASSPALTGTPTAPTATAGTNTTQIATTAFVTTAVAAGSVTSVFTRTGAVTAQTGDYTAAQVTNAADLTASNTFTAEQVVSITNAGTTDTPNVLTLRHFSSGTPAAGFGLNVRERLHSSTNTERTAHFRTVSWATATDASRKARVTWSVEDTAAREYLRGEASGTAAMIGFLGAAAAARQTGDMGAALVTFGLMSGTPTVAVAALPVFVQAGGSHAAGIVPDPGATAHTNFPFSLRDDGTFKINTGEVLGYNLTTTAETTSSTSFVDLTTAQSITFTLDAAADVMVIVSTILSNTSAAAANRIAVDVNGSDTAVANYTNPAASSNYGVTNTYKFSLSSGSNTLKMQFSVSAGTATFSNRMITILRLT